MGSWQEDKKTIISDKLYTPPLDVSTVRPRVEHIVNDLRTSRDSVVEYLKRTFSEAE